MTNPSNQHENSHDIGKKARKRNWKPFHAICHTKSPWPFFPGITFIEKNMDHKDFCRRSQIYLLYDIK